MDLNNEVFDVIMSEIQNNDLNNIGVPIIPIQEKIKKFEISESQNKIFYTSYVKAKSLNDTLKFEVFLLDSKSY